MRIDLARNIIFTFCCFSFISCAYKITPGHYKGTEAVHINSDGKIWPGLETQLSQETNIDRVGRKWFLEVNMFIKRTSILIRKVPYYIENSVKSYSDSTGGYYYYSGSIEFDSERGVYFAYAHMDSCRHCPRTSTATPLYTSGYYEIRRYKNKLLASWALEKFIVLKRD